MAMTEARVAGVDDVKLVATIAAQGFYQDPVMCWVFPDRASRLDLLHIAFEGLLDTYLPDAGTVHVLDDACASMWRSPTFDYTAPAEPRPVSGRNTEPRNRPSRAALFTADILERFAILSAALEANHPPSPHWYLNVLSTVPDRQGQGLGASTLAPLLAICDVEGVPAYLESSNPRNIPFYERQGFALTGEITLPDCPSLFPMWREPRS
jgi:GNAT superfamily N-acetyltransferase